MSCPAITNKGGKLSISRFPVACELTLTELALLDYAVVPGVGSIGDTGIEQDISSYSTTNAGISPQSKAAAVGKVWDVEMLESQSEARDIFEAASAVGNKDTYATRIEWPDGAVEFSIVQVSSPTYVKGAPSGVRIVRYTMVPSFIPIVTNSLPVATSVAIGGIPFIGVTLAATYSYYSPLGLPESGTEYQWYADGVAIPGETSTSLLVTGGHLGSLITFGVTPSDGLSYGHEAISVPVGPVADSARFTADAPDLYTDTALTVPVASYGDAVAGWRGGVLVGVQPTLTARPAYGRMPEGQELRNWLVTNFPYSSVDLETGWNVNGGTLAESDGWWIFTESLVDEAHGWGGPASPFIPASANVVMTVSLTVKAGTRRYLYFGRAAGSNYSLIVVDTQTWTVVDFGATPVSGGTLTDYGIEDLGDGEYRLHTTGRVHSYATSASSLTLRASDSPTLTWPQPTFVGDASTLSFKDPQIELDELTPYQRVDGPYDVTESGVPDMLFLDYDLGDDVLPDAMDLPAVAGGTLVIAGENGIWVDDSFNHAGGSWSLGPTTYTGGPAGLLPSLIGNRVLGFTVFAGQLTPEQLEVEVTGWMAKGAPGFWEAGGELVTNPGGPYVDTAGWTPLNSTISVVSGSLLATATSPPDNLGARTPASVAAGEMLLVEYEGLVLPAVDYLSSNVATSWVLLPGDSDGSMVFASPDSITAIGPKGFGNTASWSRFSVSKLTLNTDPYP